jgi:hypothetical protein
MAILSSPIASADSTRYFPFSVLLLFIKAAAD